MKLLMHICCSNCALYPVTVLRDRGINVNGLWFNPNIHPFTEYQNRLDSLKKLETLWSIEVKYIDEYRVHVLMKQKASQEFFALETNLQTIFEGVIEDEADPSLWWVIISTGSIIVLTLSYVGWRKFKGEREKRKTPSR